MPATFDGNDGNDGNSANAGGGGNATSSSGGWFFADRVNLPLVTQPDSMPGSLDIDKMIGTLDTINQPKFPDRNWSAEWYAWLALTEFATAVPLSTLHPATQSLWPSWVPATPPPNWSTLNTSANVQGEIVKLVTAAMEERADALSEILSQSDEFISYFLNMMTSRPGAYPETTKVLAIASLIGTYVAMYFKDQYRRPRPSELCPALLPPIEVPGHASLPSGHSTQAHLMALCMQYVLTPPTPPSLPQMPTMGDDLWTLADRIARNREIAGLHYESDSQAGAATAQEIMDKLKTLGASTKFQTAVTNARAEWTP